jgi:dihydroorotate dehydrogenase
MSWLYRNVIRPSLFAQDSETIHNFTINTLGRLSRTPLLCQAVETFLGAAALPVNLWGLSFPNPVGLAAGMDKEAEALPAWQALGFGFSELGAVTWHPQPGNPRPRVFRAISDEALVNRMGFNNSGAEAMAARLEGWRRSERWPAHPVGVNLGKSKVTPLAQAAEDYARSLQVLWPHLDFFVVNVSSPNTPNLRQLQDKSALDEILAALQEVNRKLAAGAAPVAVRPGRQPAAPALQPKPILVKVAPDLAFDAIDEILELVQPRALAGIVATNTTITRPVTSDPALRRIYDETGGLSGKPLRERSSEVIRHVFRRTQGTVPIIGVGGIFTAEDAWEKVTAGASLVQVYTGLVYEGPALVKRIVQGLHARLQEQALPSLVDAIGREHRANRTVPAV